MLAGYTDADLGETDSLKVVNLVAKDDSGNNLLEKMIKIMTSLDLRQMTQLIRQSGYLMFPITSTAMLMLPMKSKMQKEVKSQLAQNLILVL